MSYSIKGLLTSELTGDTLSRITESFNSVFKKDYPVNYFVDKYSNSSLGFSFHGLLYYNESIVGSFSVIPKKYQANNKHYTFGLACDAFILEEHRKDELFLKKMHQSVVERLAEFQVSFVFSIPNDIAYPYWKYMVKYKDIGEMNYYVYPVNIGALVSSLKFLNPLSSFFAGAWSGILPLFKNEKQLYAPQTNICLHIDEEYLAQRFNSTYTTITLSSTQKFTYKIIEEDGIRVAYLFHLSPSTTRCLNKAMSVLLKQKKNFDVVMFIGNWSNKPLSLIKVPREKEPRKQRFIGTILDANNCPEGVLNIKNWRLSLSDFDNR